MAHEEQDYVDGWLTYSEWIDGLRDDSDLITDLDDDDDFKERLLACPTNLERFKFIWSNEKLRNEVEKFHKQDLQDNLDQISESLGKSSTESKKMRDLGNQSFKEGNYAQALNYYTLAIKYAPYPSQDHPDETMSLALANRSAALYSMTRYRSCLPDIDLAIKLGYPEANLFKLLIRKVKCLHILRVWANDVEEIKGKLTQILKNPQTKEYIRTEINNMFEFVESSHPESMPMDEEIEDESVIKICNTSKTVPQAADCIEMSYSNDKGRYLLTNKDITFGRLLITEDPFVCNLAPSKRSDYCYNCFGRLYSCGLSCKNCTQILYCSLDCIEENSKIHSHECNRFIFFQPKLGVAYLVAHIMFKIGFNPKQIPVYGKKFVDNKTLDEVLNIPGSVWPDMVYKSDYASIVSLMDHATDYDFDSLMGYTLTAVYLVLAFREQFPTKIPTNPEAQLLMGSLILRHLLQLQTNLISVLSQDLQSLVFTGHSLSEVQEKPIGIALYPTVSLLNHRCTPNILSIFRKSRFVARAAGSLECGSEISYCYGPSVSRMSKVDRQTRLKEQYFFECECDCCVNDTENECRALVCPKCDGPVIYNRDLSHRCLKCRDESILDARSVLRKIEELKSELEDLSSSHSDNLERFIEIENLLSKLAYWRNPVFVRIKSQLIECANSKGDHDLALKYGREELELADKTYGEKSLESIMTKLKYINLDWQRLSEKNENPDPRQLDEAIKSSYLKELKDLQGLVQSTRGKLKDLLNSTSILGAESSFDQELKFLSETYVGVNKSIADLEGTSENESLERTKHMTS